MDREGHEIRVPLDHLLQLPLVEEFVRVFGEVNDHRRATLFSLCRPDLKTGAAIRNPLAGLCIGTVGARDDLYLFGSHECRIKADAELSDHLDGGTFLFAQFLHALDKGSSP